MPHPVPSALPDRVVVDLGGERFAALSLGAVEPGDPRGETMLWLHGFPDTPTSLVAAMQAAAGPGVLCVAPWMRGYAPSPTRGPFDLGRLVSDVIGMADALSTERRVHLVGHDWGAALAYLAALRAPDRFASLFAMSVPHPHAFLRSLARPAQLRRSAYMAFFQLPFVPERAIRERGLVSRLWRAWSPGFEPPPGHLDDVTDTIVRSLPGPLAYYRGALRPASIARLREARRAPIRVPTLYAHGDTDGCIHRSAARGQRRHFEGELREVTLLGAGHFLPMERPDEVGRLARAWVASHPSYQ